jgi:hypothetical protein
MHLLRLLTAVAGLISIAVPAHAVESREKARLIVLDKCVADEWKVRPVKDKIVEECKCAATKVARDLSPMQVASLKTEVPKTPRDYWGEATAACFKKPDLRVRPG